MIEIVDTHPDVQVSPAEYVRLLGYPAGWALRDRALELSDWARSWYASHGHPWIYARAAGGVDVSGGVVRIDDVAFTSPRLLKTLEAAGADGVVVVAAGAGPELELEAQARWTDEKPDEYFFLEVYGSAVVEQLVTMAGAHLCAWADGEGLAVLPHDSPGYPGWNIAEQAQLLAVLDRTPGRAATAPLDVLESGMLRPKKSILAVFGLTRHVDRVRRLTELVPCERCSFHPCQYRRTPYRRAPLDRAAGYTVNAKALRRWAAERLTLTRQPDGEVEALFRYEGTTCTNMGRALEFHYRVTLGPRDEGYPIRAESCGPAPGDTGHMYMCRHLSHRDELMAAIDTERPLAGRRLNEVLGWARPAFASGCYCEPDARQHKWGLVLETIHYALATSDAPGDHNS